MCLSHTLVLMNFKQALQVFVAMSVVSIDGGFALGESSLRSSEQARCEAARSFGTRKAKLTRAVSLFKLLDALESKLQSVPAH